MAIVRRFALDLVRNTKTNGSIKVRRKRAGGSLEFLRQVLEDSHDWPGLKAVGKITATREIDGRSSIETRCYLLSRAFPPERLNAIVRSHWGIENGLHWVLDVIMDEDQARNRKNHGRTTWLSYANLPSISSSSNP
jgi:hypothetical protein